MNAYPNRAVAETSYWKSDEQDRRARKASLLPNPKRWRSAFVGSSWRSCHLKVEWGELYAKAADGEAAGPNWLAEEGETTDGWADLHQGGVAGTILPNPKWASLEAPKARRETPDPAEIGRITANYRTKVPTGHSTADPGALCLESRLSVAIRTAETGGLYSCPAWSCVTAEELKPAQFKFRGSCVQELLLSYNLQLEFQSAHWDGQEVAEERYTLPYLVAGPATPDAPVATLAVPGFAAV